MTTWKDGGNYGRFSREIVNEDGGHAICHVRVLRFVGDYIEHWPEGTENFDLILQAPQMLAALESIRDTAACFLQPLSTQVSQARWACVRDRAIAAIAAAKGENDEKELV